jgi:crossover junction endonuclease MUS81
MKIIVDNRETLLYNRLMLINTGDISIQSEVLILGDVIIKNDQDEIIIIIERKTYQDLLSSIRDGRYNEQSHRLIHSSGLHTHNILYLIEGIMSQITSPTDKTLIYSSITSINHYKGMSIFHTPNVSESGDFILAMAIKMERNNKKKLHSCFTITTTTTINQENITGIIPYSSVVKKVKKENVTPENIGELILCQIPSISSVTAVAIMTKYHTINNLLVEITKNNQCLDNLTYSSGGKTRKISSGAIANIILYLTEKNI